MTSQSAKLLRIYINEQDQYDGKALYEAIVDRCRDLKIAGVTVFRALEGFGGTAELRHSHLFHSDQPIVITVVDHSEKLAQAIPVFEEMIKSGLVAITNVEVIAIANGVATALPEGA